MPDKIYLHLLILCGIWSHGITANFADEGIRESSDILIRKKRVLNHIPDEEYRVPIGSVSYVVMIKQNRRMGCVGSILSHHVVITIALCVMYEAPQYQVISGSANLDHGTDHNVTEIRRHYFNLPNRPTDGIALLTVNTPFMYGRYTNYIQLHSEPLLRGTLGTIIGWGCYYRSVNHGTRFPKSLRSIEVPIMGHQECVNRYRPHNIQISDSDICTYHPDKHCGHSDGGAPLVVHGQLAGVHLWTGPSRGQIDPQYPDVFVLLQHSEYYQWIGSNIENIETNFQNHNY